MKRIGQTTAAAAARLTAFEAAARLGGFRMAADELGITRSAVSHQIRILEETLGLELFHRDARRALLSKAGHLYYPPVRDAFDQIESQTRLLRPGKGDNALTVQVYVTVALKWLIPRLHDFEQRFPDRRSSCRPPISTGISMRPMSIAA